MLGTGLWNTATIVHGVRHEEELGYKEELEKISSEKDDIFYIPLVSREDWSGLKGRVQLAFTEPHYERITGRTLSHHNCQVFLCGNPEMIDSMQKLLEERDFSLHRRKSPGNIHFERYW